MNLIPKKVGYFRSFDGCQIYYEVRGSGKALVFPYGIGCLMNHWQHQIKYFSQNFTTVLFDYRGHHKTEVPKNTKNLRITDIAADIIGLLNHLELPKASFISHSFGVPITLETYYTRPDIFDKMVLINGFVTNPFNNMLGSNWPNKVFHLIKELQMNMPDTTSFLWKKILRNPLANHVSTLLGGFNSGIAHWKDVEIYTQGLSSLNISSFLIMLEHMSQYDGEEKLQQIKCPTLVIGGLKDPLTSISRQENLHKCIKDSEFLVLKEGSHCTQLDKPEITNLKIERFLLK